MANMNTVRLSVPEKLAMPTNLSKSERAAEFLRQLPTIGSGVNPTTGRRLYVPQDSGYSRSRKNTRCRGCGKQIKTRGTFCRRCYQKARRHIVWFADYAVARSLSMTSKWKETITSLLMAY